VVVVFLVDPSQVVVLPPHGANVGPFPRFIEVFSGPRGEGFPENLEASSGVVRDTQYGMVWCGAAQSVVKQGREEKVGWGTCVEGTLWEFVHRSDDAIVEAVEGLHHVACCLLIERTHRARGKKQLWLAQHGFQDFKPVVLVLHLFPNSLPHHTKFIKI
jgi:hypothetical protein